MQFNYKYSSRSTIANGTGNTAVSFAPDTLREPTYFVGQLGKKIPFREAISALHDVVIADFNFQPKDRTAYMEWLQEQEKLWLVEAMGSKQKVYEEIAQLREELKILRSNKSGLLKSYNKAKRNYFNHIYKRDYTAWLILDPVITVHPDQVFFECFSKDESVYGKLSCDYEVFDNISEFKCGTTNIDYSQTLYNEFQKIRTYKQTEFKIDPGGFDIQTTGEDTYREVKIDLPDSWVRGFLQVSSAMTANKVTLALEPADIANIIFILKRNKERQGPRSLKYVLEPGKPIKIIFEPWNIELECPRSIYQGKEATEIRVWGRRRIALLERLLPITQSFTVHLLGTGMPSFYTAHLTNNMYFTLGLSGWTANDWAKSSQLDLLTPRGEVAATTMQTIYLGLRKNWYSTGESLANNLNIPIKDVKVALATFAQAGKVIYDLKNEVYRARELKREGIDIDSLRFSSDTDRKAYEIAQKKDGVRNIQSNQIDGLTTVNGLVDNNYHSQVIIDNDLNITDGQCNCSSYRYNKMTKGPCEHILALRIAFDKL